MRITFQPSSGRGEYEVSEESAPNALVPSKLLELSVHLLIGKFVIHTGVKLKKVQGKYRLRVEPKNAHPQVPMQLANVLLMPKPIRQESKMGGGEPVLQNNSYIIKNIQFRNVNQSPDASFFTAEVHTVECQNQTNEAYQVAVLNRIADIEKIWEQKKVFPSEIAELLSQHEQYVKSTSPIPRTATNLVQQLQNHMERYSFEIEIPYTATTDVVPALLSALGGADEEMPISLEQIEPELMDLRFRERKRWQIWAASRRDAASARFRREVRTAYQCRCVMCGNCFPATVCNNKPGIDAAHILPWAVYELDKIYNGVTLCKLHHWAFDEGILLIVFREGKYYVELSEAAKSNLHEPNFSIDFLQQVVGEVPRRYLPAKTTDWPNPSLLERRNVEFANQPLSLPSLP